MAWGKRAMVAAALFALSACAGSAWSEPRQDILAQVDGGTMARAFATQAAMCFAREDTPEPIFHGCVDWHSASHAAWALSFYQRNTGDTRYAAQLEAEFTPADIAAEATRLRNNPRFEMPYGRAWFLRLAVERMRMGDHRFDAMAREVALSLRDLLPREPCRSHRRRVPQSELGADQSAALCARERATRR